MFTQFWILNTTQLPLIHSQYSMSSRIVVAGQLSNIKAIQEEEGRGGGGGGGATDAAGNSSSISARNTNNNNNNNNGSPAKGGGGDLNTSGSAGDIIELGNCSINNEVISGDGKSLVLNSDGEGILLEDPKKVKKEADEVKKKRVDLTTNAMKEYPDELFRPLMYFPEKMGKKMSFRGSHTHWSEPFSIGGAGTWEVVDLPQAKRSKNSSKRGLFQFVVLVERAVGKYWRTRTLVIKPRIILINHTKKELRCCQHGESHLDVVLAVDEQRPFHWVNAKREQLLCARFGGDDWNWSPGFRLFENHKMTIKARNLRSESALLKVRVYETEGTLMVVFDEEHPEFPTYKLHNASSEPVRIHQYLAVPHVYEIVPPGASVAYAWDNPSIVPLLLEVLSLRDEKILLDLDGLGLFNTSNPEDMLKLDPIEGLGHFYGVVTAEGPSKVATIKLNNSSQPFPDHISNAAAVRKQKLTVHVSLLGFGLSIINKAPIELVYISMSHINLDYEDNRREQSLEFSIGHLQVDNQSFVSQFPVLLWTRPKVEKFFTISLVRSADYVSVHFIKRMSMFIDDMDVSMDDSVFLKVWDFVANVAKALGHEKVNPDEELRRRQQQQRYTVPTGNLKSRQVYLQEFTLSGTNLLVSFINTDSTDDGQLGETAVSRIIRTYGALVNIERAPVKLAPLNLAHQFLSQDELSETLKEHYVTGMRKGLAKILASADFIGAPMALAGHVREGARDLVNMPRKGAARDGMSGAISGVGKGTASLAKSVGYGTFNSLSKISGTIGDGFSQLALDENYEKERAKLARNRPEHVGEGIAYGARDLGLGFFRGVSGVFVEPVRGAKEDGVRGFFTGISRGITGLYVKPAVGVVDMVTRTAEGMKNTTTYWEEKKRVREPRFIGAEGVLQVFQKHKAEGQGILYGLASGKFFLEEREYYKAHFAIGIKVTLLVTDMALIQVKDGSVDFYLPLASIDKIVIDTETYSEGILVILNNKSQPKKINCIFNEQNFAKELLGLLTNLLRHEVDTALLQKTPGDSPRKGRRRSSTNSSARASLYDRLFESDSEEIRVMEDEEDGDGFVMKQKKSSSGNNVSNNNNNNNNNNK
jgi:hypothetical protein